MNSTGNRPRRKRPLLFISAAILLIAIGITASILKINEIVSNLGAVFTILGVLLAFLHEYLPSTHSVSALPADSMNNRQSRASSYTEIEGITSATLGLARGRGALIVYTNSHLLGSSINLTFGFNRCGARADIVEHVIRRETNNRPVFVAIFQGLPGGSYTVCSDALRLEEKVTIDAGEVKRIDCRHRTHKPTTHQRQTGISPVRGNNEA